MSFSLPCPDGLDEGIAEYVRVLREHGIDTFESCNGAPGHAYTEPTIRFCGQREEGFRALAVALEHGFPVCSVRRYWDVLDGEPSGPNWELTFWALSAPESSASRIPYRDGDRHPALAAGAVA